MQFVQKTVFFSDGISQDLVNLLGSYGETEIKKAFENAKRPDSLVSLMKEIISYDFIDIPEQFVNNSHNNIPYQSMEKALKQLKYFTKNNTYFGDEQLKLRKLSVLLESLTFIEADIFLRLIKNNYDKEGIKNYLYPQTRKTVVDKNSNLKKSSDLTVKSNETDNNLQ